MHQTNLSSWNSTSGISKSKSKKLLTKADIGLPMNFQHIQHVGWDPNSGFDLDGTVDKELQDFFNKVTLF